MTSIPRPGRNHVEQLEHAVRALTVGIESSRAEIVAALETTIRGVPQRGARVVPAVDGNGNGAVVTTTSGRLAGLNLRETSGQGYLVVRLHDSRDIFGDTVFETSLSGGTSFQWWCMPEGVNYAYGLTVEIAAAGAGSVLAGQIYLAGQ